jgi:hypothetical protein
VADEPTDQATEADQLSDELAKKYDPERLLKIMAKRAGRGDSLDHSVRSKYEKKFGVDLGHVRIFSGEFAEEFNKQRNAYAVTIGSTGMILMGNSPDRSMATASGQALLAHELTHVAQAKGGLHRAGKQQMVYAEEHEVEAEEVEHAELAGAGGGGHAHAASAKPSKEDHEATIEKIKARVIEMAGEAAHAYYQRNGTGARRP